MANAFDPNRWTMKTQEALQSALTAARDAANPEATPDHLLAALLRQDDTVTLPLLTQLGVQPLSLRNEVDERLQRLPHAYGSEPQLGRDLRDVLARADQEREKLHDDYL